MSGGKKSKNQLVLLLIICTIVVSSFFTVFFTFSGEKGLVNTYNLFVEKQKVQRNIKKLKHENLNLKSEIKQLKFNSYYISQKIKDNLGMLEKFEVVYIFGDKTKNE
ncbi:MAG: septum formation initiator family protein [Pseudomonadota bacterium]